MDMNVFYDEKSTFCTDMQFLLNYGVLLLRNPLVWVSLPLDIAGLVFLFYVTFNIR